MSAAGRLALAVLLAWLMPWRAVATIRSQEESIGYMIRAVMKQAERLERYEPRPEERHLRLVK